MPTEKTVRPLWKPGSFLIPIGLLLLASSAQSEPLAICRWSGKVALCVCSISSFEAQMTFGEAADLVATFESADPGPHNEQLVLRMFRQCAHATKDGLKLQ